MTLPLWLGIVLVSLAAVGAFTVGRWIYRMVRAVLQAEYLGLEPH